MTTRISLNVSLNNSFEMVGAINCPATIDEDGWAWLNGEKIGETIFNADVNPDSWKLPLDLDVTGKLKTGTNVVAVRVRDRSGLGGLWRPCCLIYGQDAPNLLEDGSFENEAKGWSFSGKGDVSHRLTDTGGYESNHCLEISVPEDPDAHWSMSTQIAATAGERYAFSFRYKTRDVGTNPKVPNSPAIRFIMRDEARKTVTPPRGPGYVWSSIRAPANSDGWLEATVYVQAIERTTAIYVTTFIHRPGTWCVDNARLWKLGPGGER